MKCSAVCIVNSQSNFVSSFRISEAKIVLKEGEKEEPCSGEEGR